MPIGINRSARRGVVSAIPDASLLRARYSADDDPKTDGAGLTAIPDQTDNDIDLSGTASYKTTSTNLDNVYRFDGSSDIMEGALNTDIEPPYAAFWTSEFNAIPSTSDDEYFVSNEDGDAGSSSRWGLRNDGSGENNWILFSDDDNLDSGVTADADPHIFGVIIDDSGSDSSSLRIDGVETATGSIGVKMAEVVLGDWTGGSIKSPVDFDKFLLFDEIPNISNVESYLDQEVAVL